MNELISKIEQWAEDRNIIKGSKPIDQAMKLFSEFGELADNVGKGRDCRDDIGDVFVVLTIISKQNNTSLINVDFDYESYAFGDIKSMILGFAGELALFVENSVGYDSPNTIDDIICRLKRMCNKLGYTLEECVQIAYNDIKDRKGLMHNGVFIKESDPAYATVVAAIESNCTIDEDALDNIEADKRMATQKRISVNLEDL